MNRFRSSFLAAAMIAGALAGASSGCRFSYDNPAERLIPGEIRGRAVQEREGETGTFVPAEGTRVRLRGLPFVLDTRNTGFFAFLDLPVGEYQVLLDAVVAGEHPRATQRRVQIALGSDGQPEGVTLGDVPLLYTASLSGSVVDELTGNPIPYATVVDDVSLLSVTADENGDFTFPSLSIGNHVLRAAGAVFIDDDTTKPLVGGTLSVTLEKSHERGAITLSDHLVMRDATDRGRVQMEIGLMTPGRPPFGLDEVEVKATSCDGKRTLELQPPSSNGQVDDPEVPEGCWNIHLEPPEGPQSAEFTLRTGVENVVVLKDADVHLGKLLLVSSSSLLKSRLACDVDADCGEGGVCNAGRCADAPAASDPCEHDNGGCSPDATCSSVEGIVHCSCNDGFSGNGRTCSDVDECLLELDDCSADAICTNTVGSYGCACEDGFEGDGFACVDVDECVALDPETETPLHLCGANAVCSNTQGSYDCACETGFSGDGFACEDVDECAEGTDACDPNAACTNTFGGYECACETGFVGDGFTCEDVDECTEVDPQSEAPLHTCDVNAVCTNTPGSHECACPTGMVGDGHTCASAFVTLAAGYSHNCGIRSDGSLWCWGLNAAGQLGNATTDDQPQPIRVDHPSGLLWSRVFAGDNASCALDSESKLLCWGDNYRGELGIEGQAMGYVDIPTPVTTDVSFVSVALGTGLTCGVTDAAELWCWGDDHGTEVPEPFVDGGTANWISIQAFENAFCGVRREEVFDQQTLVYVDEFQVHCWGPNSHYQFGDTSSYLEFPEYIGVFSRLNPPRFALGYGQFCVIDDDDALWCRGDGYDGTQRMTDGTFTSVSARYNTCAVGTDQSLRCWGENSNGETGTGLEGWVEEPTPVAGNLEVTHVTLGGAHTCAVGLDGHLYCWGENDVGQLALENFPKVLNALRVGEADDWRRVHAGSGNTCGIRADDTLWCWGYNSRSRLGAGDPYGPVVLNAPTPIAADTRWDRISQWGEAGCGIDTEGGLWCWGGRNVFSSAWGTEDVPLRLHEEDTWLNVAVGGTFTCAIRESDRSLWCGGEHRWVEEVLGGLDALGQPLSGASDAGYPLEDDWEQIGAGEPIAWHVISAGAEHACGIDSDGRLLCWGNDWNGQLGNNFENYEGGFVEVLLDETTQPSWVAVDSGDFYTCAIDDQTRLWCWGNSEHGQVGPSAQPTQGTPVQIGGAGWAEVTTGESHACALRADGTASCWGDNRAGTLGNGNDQVTTGVTPLDGTWTQVSAGYSSEGNPDQQGPSSYPGGHTCGIRPDGSLWCWGSSAYGQIGNGVAYSAVPKRAVTPAQ